MIGSHQMTPYIDWLYMRTMEENKTWIRGKFTKKIEKREKRKSMLRFKAMYAL